MRSASKVSEGEVPHQQPQSGNNILNEESLSTQSPVAFSFTSTVPWPVSLQEPSPHPCLSQNPANGGIHRRCGSVWDWVLSNYLVLITSESRADAQHSLHSTVLGPLLQYLLWEKE